MACAHLVKSYRHFHQSHKEREENASELGHCNYHVVAPRHRRSAWNTPHSRAWRSIVAAGLVSVWVLLFTTVEAAPVSFSETYLIDLGGEEGTLNVVTQGLVEGGTPPRRIVFLDVGPDVGERDPELDDWAEQVGDLCIRWISNSGSDFNIDFIVEDADGNQSEKGGITFRIGGGPRPIDTQQCGEPEGPPPPAVELPDLVQFANGNPTKVAVASAIDVVCPDLGERLIEGTLPDASRELLDRCSALKEQADRELDGLAPEGGISDALEQIAGEEMLSKGTSAVQIANLQTSNIASRIAALRGGSSGASLGGLALSIEGKQLPGAVVSSLLPNQANLGGGASGDEANPWSRLGVFLNGRWNFGDKDQTELESGFDFDTYGLTGGIDYRVTDSLILGLALGYSDTKVEFSGDNDRIDGDAWNIAAYGTWYSGNFYVDFSVGLGDMNFDATRTLRFVDNRGGVDSETRGKTDGDQRSYFISTGYNFASGPWTIGPYVSLDHLKADIDGFEESGGQGWALAYDNQTIKSTIATGGARMSYAMSASWGVFLPHLRADFKKEFEDNARIIRARFALDPGNTVFEFRTDEPDTSFYTWAVGFSFVTKHGFSGFVDYEALAGYANLESTTLTAGIRFQRAFR